MVAEMLMHGNGFPDDWPAWIILFIDLMAPKLCSSVGANPAVDATLIGDQIG